MSAWSERRTRTRAQTEARHLAREARGILKRGENIPQSVVAEIEGAVAEVERAAEGADVEKMRATATALDEKMDAHLAFARKSSLREYGESIGVAVAIALLLRAFVIEAFQIPSGSMIPTLEIGDHIFVSKFSYGIGIPFTNTKILQLGQPKRGDVIVFKYPKDPDVDYIKRVVGLPGDRVEVRKNEIFINGRPMPREKVAEPCEYENQPCDRWSENLDGKVHTAIHQGVTDYQPNPPHQVPPRHVFVMGDNRDNSNDSRIWGDVPLELIKGRALIVWWSRGPTSGEISFSGVKEWFGAIRWSRFFSLVR